MEKLKNKYITKEFGTNLIVSLAILIFLFCLESLLRIVDLVVLRTFTLPAFLKFFLLTVSATVPYILPLAFLCAAISLFTRLSADREIIVLMTAGIKPTRLLPLLVVSSLALSLFLFYFNQFILPGTRKARREMLYQIRSGNPVNLLREGMAVTDIPGFSIYVGKKKGNLLKNVFISFQDTSKQTHFLRAETAVVNFKGSNGCLEFDLKNGWLLATSGLKNGQVTRMEFMRYRLQIPLPGYYQQAIPLKVAEMSFHQLRKEKKNLQKSLELTRRNVFALAPVIFVFFGAGLGMRLKHKNRGFHIGVGALSGLLFFEIMSLGEILAQKAGFCFSLYLPVAIFAGLSWILWK